jgi:hypothetical protein
MHFAIVCKLTLFLALKAEPLPKAWGVCARPRLLLLLIFAGEG